MKTLKNIKSFEEFLNEGATNEDLSAKMEHYMFFEDMKSIARMMEKLQGLDPSKIDSLLSNGHDWAADHMAAAKSKLGEVTGFLINELSNESFDR